MQAFEYELLRDREPHLDLPPWRYLNSRSRNRARRMNSRQLYASRAARILARAIGNIPESNPEEAKARAQRL